MRPGIVDGHDHAEPRLPARVDDSAHEGGDVVALGIDAGQRVDLLGRPGFSEDLVGAHARRFRGSALGYHGFEDFHGLAGYFRRYDPADDGGAEALQLFALGVRDVVDEIRLHEHAAVDHGIECGDELDAGYGKSLTEGDGGLVHAGPSPGIAYEPCGLAGKLDAGRGEKAEKLKACIHVRRPDRIEEFDHPDIARELDDVADRKPRMPAVVVDDRPVIGEPAVLAEDNLGALENIVVHAPADPHGFYDGSRFEPVHHGPVFVTREIFI